MSRSSLVFTPGPPAFSQIDLRKWRILSWTMRGQLASGHTLQQVSQFIANIYIYAYYDLFNGLVRWHSPKCSRKIHTDLNQLNALQLESHQNASKQSGQIIIFHQPRFPWNKGNSIPQLHFGGNSVVWGCHNFDQKQCYETYEHAYPPWH